MGMAIMSHMYIITKLKIQLLFLLNLKFLKGEILPRVTDNNRDNEEDSGTVEWANGIFEPPISCEKVLPNVENVMSIICQYKWMGDST